MDDPSGEEPQDDATPETIEALGLWLQKLRGRANVSQRGLAKSLGIDRTTLRRWEYGKNEVGAIDLLRIFSALGVQVTPPPHGSFAKSPTEEIRDLRRELFGYPQDAPPRLDLAERVASDRDELKKVAAEMGITQREVTELIQAGGHRALEGRLGELAARVTELADLIREDRELRGTAVDGQHEAAQKPPQAGPKRKGSAGK